jgi:hypothetical protein
METGVSWMLSSASESRRVTDCRCAICYSANREKVLADRWSKFNPSVTYPQLKALAAETHQNVSGLLTEAIRDYVQKKRIRPEVLNHLDQSIPENEELGELLAK